MEGEAAAKINWGGGGRIVKEGRGKRKCWEKNGNSGALLRIEKDGSLKWSASGPRMQRLNVLRSIP